MSRPIPPNSPLISIQRIVFGNAREKGFHDTSRSGAELCALIHSEVSELFEEYRDGRDPKAVRYGIRRVNGGGPLASKIVIGGDEPYPEGVEGLNEAADGSKPEGIPVELADIVIRCLDTAEELGIDLDYEIRRKHAYNCTRPHKHGKVL